MLNKGTFAKGTFRIILANNVKSIQLVKHISICAQRQSANDKIQVQAFKERGRIFQAMTIQVNHNK
jgi:hypothetical protein